jgi:WD40 repeat protein
MKPQFVLRHVYSDGTASEPQVVPVTAAPLDTKMDRRVFFRAGMTVPAALSFLAGCGSGPEVGGVPEVTAPAGSRRAHAGPVTALITSASGLLISGSADGTVKLWSLPDGALKSTLRGHSGPVQDLAVALDSKFLVSSSTDGSIMFWSLPEGRAKGKLSPADGPVSGLAISADGRWLAAAFGRRVRVWNLPTRRLAQTLESSNGTVGALIITPEGPMLLVGGESGSVEVWSLEHGRLVDTHHGLKTKIRTLAYAPNAGVLVSTSGAGVEVWNWLSPSSIHDKYEAVGVASVAVNGSGDAMAYAFAGGIKIQSLYSGKALDLLRASGGAFRTVAFWGHDDLLASGDDIGHIELWRLSPLEFRAHLTDVNAESNAVAKHDPPTKKEKPPGQQTSHKLKSRPQPNDSDDHLSRHSPSFPSPSISRPSISVPRYTPGNGISGTQACGTPIPPGAICTCNCVAR